MGFVQDGVIEIDRVFQFDARGSEQAAAVRTHPPRQMCLHQHIRRSRALRECEALVGKIAGQCRLCPHEIEHEQSP